MQTGRVRYAIVVGLLSVAQVVGLAPASGSVDSASRHIYEDSTYEEIANDPALTDDHKIIIRFYAAVFAREPDDEGIRFWLEAYDSGEWSFRRIAGFFVTSPEFEALYGAATTNLEFVRAMYPNVLGRAPDQEGERFWTNFLNEGNDRSEMILLTSNASEFIEANPLPPEQPVPAGPEEPAPPTPTELSQSVPVDETGGALETDRVSVELETGAIAGDADLVISSNLSSATVPFQDLDWIANGYPVDIEIEGAELRGGVSLAFPVGSAAEEVGIAYLDEESNQWVSVPSTFDPSTGVVAATVDHLSTWTTWARCANSLCVALDALASELGPTDCSMYRAQPSSGTVTLEYLRRSSDADPGFNDYRMSGTVRWDSQDQLDCFDRGRIDWAYEHETAYQSSIKSHFWNRSLSFGSGHPYWDFTGGDRNTVTTYDFGLYRPEDLRPGVDYTYSFELLLPADPVEGFHSFYVAGEVIEKAPCGQIEINPALCVGSPPYNARGSEAFVGAARRFEVDGTTCWSWAKGSEPTLCGGGQPIPPEQPDPGELNVALTENPFVCNGSLRQLGRISGAAPGERISFSSPSIQGLLPGTADAAGGLTLWWDCNPAEAGATWSVTATSASGRSASFTVRGRAGTSTSPPPTPTPTPTPVNGSVSASGRTGACEFGSNCLIAGFSISGFSPHPGSYTCVFSDGFRASFNFSGSSVTTACYTSVAGETIRVEVNGVRSNTVLWPAVAPPPPPPPAPVNGSVSASGRTGACEFGSNCLIAGFSISGFSPHPGSYTCVFSDGFRASFNFSGSSVTTACYTSVAGETIRVEVNGVRSNTVSWPAVAPPPPPPPAPVNGSVSASGRTGACEFGSNCLIAGFSISGFSPHPGSYTCVFSDGFRASFNFSGSSVTTACYTSVAGETIRVEVNGVRSNTVSWPAVAPPPPPPPASRVVATGRRGACEFGSSCLIAGFSISGFSPHPGSYTCVFSDGFRASFNFSGSSVTTACYTSVAGETIRVEVNGVRSNTVS